jgi:alkylhydroperoxidase/carboxymuconolactone decarboxylase family protein YurZ
MKLEVEMEDGGERRAEELIAKMKGDRGYTYPEWEYAARANPDFIEAYNDLYRRSLTDGQLLSAKVREFVAIGILAFRGETDAVRTHMQRAMRLGATKEELLEAIEPCIVAGGASTFLCGLKALMQATSEEGEGAR